MPRAGAVGGLRGKASRPAVDPHPGRNKECPTCRKKLVSKRSLRPDPNFDALISKIYPSRDEYEAHQDRVLAKLSRLHNQQALSSSIEEGLKMQAMHRCRGGGDPGTTLPRSGMAQLSPLLFSPFCPKRAGVFTCP